MYPIKEGSYYKNPLPYRCEECDNEYKSAGELAEHLEWDEEYSQEEISEHLKRSSKRIQTDYKKQLGTVFTGKF